MEKRSSFLGISGGGWTAIVALLLVALVMVAYFTDVSITNVF